MGRPLNKKYFGNLNEGSTTTTADDGIGGRGVASIPVTTPSTYQTRPTFNISAPSLVAGVTATGEIISEVDSVVITAAGTGYAVGDIITVKTATGSAAVKVATVTAGAVSSVNFTAPGYRGEFTVLPAAGTAQATTSNGAGTGATLTLTFRAASVDVTDPGSGYVAVPTVSGVTQSVVLGTPVLTVTTTATTLGKANNPYPAIVAYAFSGGSSRQADIVKQVSTTRYKVKTADTVNAPFIAQLKTTGAPAVLGEMTITATDSGNNTYYISKLTSLKASLIPYGAGTHEFPLINGTQQSISWTFGTPVNGVSVKVDNA